MIRVARSMIEATFPAGTDIKHVPSAGEAWWQATAGNADAWVGPIQVGSRKTPRPTS